MPDPDFRVSGPDFWICILHKSSHLTILPCPDFRVHFFTNPPSYLWRLKSACQMWVWAMAQTPKKWGFEPWLGNFSEPWLKVLFFGGLSHGSKSNNWCVRAMAQSPIIDEFEPWLKVQQFGCLSHGSKSNNWLVWAMAQSPIIWMFEPWLKGQ